MHLDAKSGTYAYLRQLDDDILLAAFNLSDQTQMLTLDLPGFSKAENLLNNQLVETSPDAVRLSLDPLSGMLVKLEE